MELWMDWTEFQQFWIDWTESKNCERIELNLGIVKGIGLNWIWELWKDWTELRNCERIELNLGILKGIELNPGNWKGLN